MDELKILPLREVKSNDKCNTIKEWMPGYKGKPFLMCVLGPVRSGKSVLINNLIYNENFGYCDMFEKVIIFSPTVEIDDSMRFINQDEDIIKFTGEDLENMDDILKSIIEEQKDTDKDDREHILIIIDDLIEKLKSKTLSNLCSRYRHYKISLILTSQYYKSFSPIIRSNAGYWVLYKSHVEKERNKIDDDFNMYPGFIRYYDEAVKEKYHFLYCNQERRVLYKDFTYKLFQD